METDEKFVTVVINEEDCCPPGLSVPLPGDTIFEWRRGDIVLARLVAYEDGIPRMVYGP